VIARLYQVKCDGCGLGCGGIFSDLAAAEALREALGWVRLEYPQTLANLFTPEPVRHACPSCFRTRNAPEVSPT